MIKKQIKERFFNLKVFISDLLRENNVKAETFQETLDSYNEAVEEHVKLTEQKFLVEQEARLKAEKKVVELERQLK